MTDPQPNMDPIGVAYPVGEQVFRTHTPRGILADALDDGGRAGEAELVRGPAPVVLADPVRLPHAGDVVAQLHRLVPGAAAGGFSLFSVPGGAFDAVHLADRAADVGDDSGRRFRWPAAGGRHPAGVRRPAVAEARPPAGPVAGGPPADRDRGAGRKRGGGIARIRALGGGRLAIYGNNRDRSRGSAGPADCRARIRARRVRQGTDQQRHG